MRQTLLKRLMRLRERFPDPATFQGHEVFDHVSFSQGTPAQRRETMHRLSANRYALEQRSPFGSYFGQDLAPFLQGKTVLDLGCFTGGASVALAERYHTLQMYGLDIRDVHVEAAHRFAGLKGVKAYFAAAVGEALPFREASFDAIVSFDVLEHVQDVHQVLSECWRVLKPGGTFLPVFPGYFQPIEHHLSMVTLTPGLHWVYSGQELVQAYSEIVEERGGGAAWYRRSSPTLQSWERCNTINGMEVGAFRRLVQSMDWEILLDRRLPILGAGQIVRRIPGLRLVPALLRHLLKIPRLEEYLSHRIVYILRKTARNQPAPAA